MASFTGQTIATTYKRILTIDSENFAADASAKYIKDGDAGTASALSLSTTTVCVNNSKPQSALTISGSTDVDLLGDGDKYLTLDRDDSQIDEMPDLFRHIRQRVKLDNFG